MQVTGKMVQKGAKAGLEATWELAKVVVPTAVVVAVFRASGMLDSITGFFAPYMSWFGMSGEAALVLFSGYLINLYAAVGSIMALTLSLKDITICGLPAFLLMGSSTSSEKAGSPLSYIFFVRLGCSLLVGWILGVVLP